MLTFAMNMEYKVVFSEQSEKDLRSIYEYIAVKLLSPTNAYLQFSRIEERILSLESMPLRFKLYNSKNRQKKCLHIMNIDNYVVLYAVDDENKIVSIVRIMYGGRDIERQLTENQIKKDF